MGPSGGGDFGNSEVFKGAEASTKLSGEKGDFASGGVECVTRAKVKVRVNCEGKEAIRRRFGHTVRELFGLVLRTVSTPP